MGSLGTFCKQTLHIGHDQSASVCRQIWACTPGPHCSHITGFDCCCLNNNAIEFPNT